MQSGPSQSSTSTAVVTTAVQASTPYTNYQKEYIALFNTKDAHDAIPKALSYIRKGQVPPDTPISNGKTIAHLIMENPYQYNHLDEFKRLKGNLNATDNAGLTPLHYLAFNHRTAVSQPIQKFLSLGGRVAGIKFTDSRNFLSHICADFDNFLSCIWSENYTGDSITASEIQRKLNIFILTELVHTLVEVHKIPVNEKDDKQQTALAYLLNQKMDYNHYAVCFALVKFGADTNVVNENKDTLLHRLIKDVFSNRIDLADRRIDILDGLRTLIHHNDALLSIKDKDGNTALQVLLNSLEEGFAKSTRFNPYDPRHVLSVACEMISLGADINLISKNGKTLLHLLIENFTKHEVADRFRELHIILISQRPFPAIDFVRTNNSTPHNSLSLMGQCLEHEVDVNIILDYVYLGADSNVTSSKGTLLQRLVLNNRSGEYDAHITEIVTKYGCKVNVTNLQGKSALESLLEDPKFNFLLDMKQILNLLKLGSDIKENHAKSIARSWVKLTNGDPSVRNDLLEQLLTKYSNLLEDINKEDKAQPSTIRRIF